MEWNLFNYEEIISKPKIKPKTYTNEEYRNYIKANFKTSYNNQLFYNLLISKFFSNDSMDHSVDPKEQLIYFSQMYNNFTYHYQNEYFTIFSLRHEYDNAKDDFSVFIHVHGDFIVELPTTESILDSMCMPACAINWYNADGTNADMSKVLIMTDEEKTIWQDFVKNENEIINPKETTAFSFSEWWRDRREYYCFYKMKIHKYGKPCRVFDKHTYDCFSDYTFKLTDMLNYLGNGD